MKNHGIYIYNTIRTDLFRSNLLHIKFIISILFLCIFSSNLVAQNRLPATPYGGQRQLKEFIKQEMQYPETAYNQNIEGDVTISIYIDKSGEVTDMQIHQPVNKQLDAETRRIMRMVLWYPGTNLGSASEDIHAVTVKYKIKKYDRYCKERGYERIAHPRLPIDTSLSIYDFNNLDTIPVILFEDKLMTLSKFINENIEYPEAAMEHNLTGTETIKFIVEPSGHISNIRPTVHVGGGCCEEAVRLVRMLKWYPGIKENRAVRTNVNISITFNLTSGNDTQYVPTNMSGSMQ